jgi:hypothetical protein
MPSEGQALSEVEKQGSSLSQHDVHCEPSSVPSSIAISSSASVTATAINNININSSATPAIRATSSVHGGGAGLKKSGELSIFVGHAYFKLVSLYTANQTLSHRSITILPILVSGENKRPKGPAETKTFKGITAAPKPPPMTLGVKRDKYDKLLFTAPNFASKNFYNKPKGFK